MVNEKSNDRPQPMGWFILIEKWNNQLKPMGWRRSTRKRMIVLNQWVDLGQQENEITNGLTKVDKEANDYSQPMGRRRSTRKKMTILNQWVDSSW